MSQNGHTSMVAAGASAPGRAPRQGGGSPAPTAGESPASSALLGFEAAAALSPMLEYDSNKVKSGGEPESSEERRAEPTRGSGRVESDEKREGFVRAVPVRCRCWMCAECKRTRGYAYRERLRSKAKLFREPRLYTITVSREWHESPEAAYEYVNDGKLISRLFRLLGVLRWVWVLEPQQESGDGWPHWHVLIDVSDLPGKWYHRETKASQEATPEDRAGWCYIPHFFDLNRVHALLRKWQLGEQCRLSTKKESFRSPEHAVNYITKYLVKMPPRGFPPWMLTRARVRFTGASKAVGRLVAAEAEPRPLKGDEERKGEEETEKRSARPPLERIAACGNQLTFVQFNEHLGRVAVLGRVLGCKEALAACTWAVEVEDFDFVKQRPFTVRGFASAHDAWRFADMMESPQIREFFRARIAQRRERLLGMWGRDTDTEPFRAAG